MWVCIEWPQINPSAMFKTHELSLHPLWGSSGYQWYQKYTSTTQVKQAGQAVWTRQTAPMFIWCGWIDQQNTWYTIIKTDGSFLILIRLTHGKSRNHMWKYMLERYSVSGGWSEGRGCTRDHPPESNQRKCKLEPFDYAWRVSCTGTPVGCCILA